VIIPCGPELEYLHQGKVSLAVRIPALEPVRQFLQQTGVLLTSSANQPGEPTATTIAEAQAYFGDTVDFYVDGGTIADHAPSTLIRVVDDAIEILRKGALDIDESGRIHNEPPAAG
jgi:L-threonylcarbamoyladenylate synthase